MKKKEKGLMEHQGKGNNVEVPGRRSEIGCKRKWTEPGNWKQVGWAGCVGCTFLTLTGLFAFSEALFSIQTMSEFKPPSELEAALLLL
jgi:hypothetical protein